MDRRPVTWPGPIGGCSLVTMMALGGWLEWQRWQAGQGDAWFGAAMALAALLAFAALALDGALHKWAVRFAAYFVIFPPLALFAGAVAHAAHWM